MLDEGGLTHQWQCRNKRIFCFLEYLCFGLCCHQQQLSVVLVFIVTFVVLVFLNYSEICIELNHHSDVISTLSSLFCHMDQVVSIRPFMFLMFRASRGAV